MTGLCGQRRVSGISRGSRPFIWALAAVLLGCGGGVGSGGTGGFASGPITGFGSIIVNGVRFDESAATITDGDGRSRSRDEFRLGMTVEIESGPITTNTTTGVTTAVASRIKLQSGLRGSVTAVDVAGGSFTMLGQRVLVTPSTLFSDNLTGGLSGLTGPGAPVAVEVYAEYDAATSVYRAYRVETASATDPARVRGQVREINATTQTVRIGGATYSTSAGTAAPAGLAAGQFVSVQVQDDGSPDALSVRSWGATTMASADADDVKLNGVISTFTSVADFSIDGRRVNASTARIEPSGANLAVGSKVQVDGPVISGVLRASKVEVSSPQQEEDREFEISGAITAVTATSVLGRPLIVVRGQAISTARSDLRFEGGTAAQLVVGQRVEVKGMLGADRRTVEATKIQFDD